MSTPSLNIINVRREGNQVCVNAQLVGSTFSDIAFVTIPMTTDLKDKFGSSLPANSISVNNNISTLVTVLATSNSMGFTGSFNTPFELVENAVFDICIDGLKDDVVLDESDCILLGDYKGSMFCVNSFTVCISLNMCVSQWVFLSVCVSLSVCHCHCEIHSQ